MFDFSLQEDKKGIKCHLFQRERFQKRKDNILTRNLLANPLWFCYFQFWFAYKRAIALKQRGGGFREKEIKKRKYRGNQRENIEVFFLVNREKREANSVKI